MLINKQTSIDSLPAVVGGMVERMADKQAPMHIRDNYAATIETIVKVCSDELTKFQKERTKVNIETRTTKKKR